MVDVITTVVELSSVWTSTVDTGSIAEIVKTCIDIFLVVVGGEVVSGVDGKQCYVT